MRFLIITHAPHKLKGTSFYSYAPFVNEMNLWLKHVAAVELVAPLVADSISEIDMAYQHPDLVLTNIPSIAFTSIKNTLASVVKLPIIFFRLFKACKNADHIHLRCPGNIGLLGCMVQLFFPRKLKTAKYAGNWDPNAKQPLSYRFQKWVLGNTFLTKQMQVLVYGNWSHQSKNILPFFTASYTKDDIIPLVKRDFSGALQFVFTGTLSEGKRPLFAIALVEALTKQGFRVFLDLYGDGVLKGVLQTYIERNNLERIVKLHGNQTKDVVKEAYKQAHFVLLPSKSEGWPKAIAEGMFFGVVPIVTKVSCVPYMLDYGKRGILMAGDLDKDVVQIEHALKDVGALELMSERASNWSQQYTLDTFEYEIVKLLKWS